MIPWPSIILTLPLVLLLWLTVGNSLGLWLGGFAVTALLLPPLSLRRDTFLERILDGGGAVDCVVVVWLIAAANSNVTIGGWFQCAIALYAVAAAGFGLALLMHRLLIPATIASGVATLVMIAWLAAPVWLSPWMNGLTADFLGRFHPILAINGQLTQLGIWLEHPIVYRYTVLGQDVPYSLPASVWWCAAAHAGVGGLFLAAANAWSRPQALAVTTTPPVTRSV